MLAYEQQFKTWDKLLFMLTRDTLPKRDLYTSRTLKICQFYLTSVLAFSQSLNKFLDCGASLSRPVRFDLCPTVSFGLRHRWAVRVSRSDGLRCDLSANKLTIWMSYMSFCNCNFKSDGRRYDFFLFNYSSSLSTSESRAKTPLPESFKFLRPPAKFRQSLAYFSAIPCEPCSWKIEIFSATPKFSSLIRGDL